MYQALYRKYRPQTFEDVIGQGHITESLKNQVKSGHLSHAYIFIGTRGTGKTTCSRILAKAVNCENPINGNPCCQCDACRMIDRGEATDIVELDAASNNGVNDVRALRDEAVFSPTAMKKRVYIIDEVHMLSTPAFNALLKILEEPPEHLVFILATTELQKVPATILSRCQRHSFHRVKNSLLADYLCSIAERERLSLSHEAASLIAGLGEGSVRDSLSMLDQCSSFQSIDVDQVYSSVGLAGNKRTIELFERIAAKDTEGAISMFNSLWEDGKEPAAILRELSSFGRDILMIKVAPKSAAEIVYGGYSRDDLRKFAAAMTVEELTYAVDSLQNAVASMRERLNPKMTAELCLISLSENALGDSIGSIRARISALENMLKNGAAMVAAPPVSASEAEHVLQKTQLENPDSGQIREMRSAQEQPIQETFPKVSSPEGRPVEATETAMLCLSEKQKTEGYEDTDISEFMAKLVEEAGPKLRKDLQITLKDPGKRRAYLDAEILTIEVEPGFLYTSLNRSDMIAVLEEAAGKAAGGSVRVKISELKHVQTEPRKLSELKKYPEVRFE